MKIIEEISQIINNENCIQNAADLSLPYLLKKPNCVLNLFLHG